MKTILHLLYFFCLIGQTIAQNNPYQNFGSTSIIHYKIQEVDLSNNDVFSFYRFGFNSKENDREWGTGGLTQDYGFRLYNPALGKFLSVDPLAPDYPELTTYQFASNMPIAAIDLDGLEAKMAIIKKEKYLSATKAENIIHNTLAVPYNAGIGILNFIPNAWNFGVDLFSGKYNTPEYRADILIGRAQENFKEMFNEGITWQGLKQEALNPETYEKLLSIIATRKLGSGAKRKLNIKKRRAGKTLSSVHFKRPSSVNGLNIGELQRLNVASQVKLRKMSFADASKPLSQGGAKVNSLGDITTGKFIQISRVGNDLFEMIVTQNVEGKLVNTFKTRLSASKTGIKDIKTLTQKPLAYRKHFLGATKD